MSCEVEVVNSKRVILLVEDDPNDVFFLERALEEVKFPGELRHFTSTDEAKRYLKGTGDYADRAVHPLPVLIIADSAVAARGSGVEFLEWMKGEKLGGSAPFIILSGGVDQEMRERAEAAGVARVLTKASNYKQTAAQLREVLASL
jgi:CheY-like chemotaxis protein